MFVVCLFAHTSILPFSVIRDHSWVTTVINIITVKSDTQKAIKPKDWGGGGVERKLTHAPN